MSAGLVQRGCSSVLLLAALLASACRRAPAAESGTTSPGQPVSILLVTLDTTRADSIGPDAQRVDSPAFNALAARGQRFQQAYATVPETLPSHVSIMTGLYPAGHGIHENGRYLAPNREVVAERLHDAGYRTAAFVSSYVLSRRFGLARGFDVYDDDLERGQVERSSRDTTDRALGFLEKVSPQRLFLWVHYFDPHAPYSPPDPFRREYADRPYFGEVAAMDQQLGRLIQAFEQHVARNDGRPAFLIVGDHGEGLGDHGESQHGNLLYQSTVHVPLLVAGPGFPPGSSNDPVSTRRVFHTILEWARLGSSNSLRSTTNEVVTGEAMKPFLGYGWQPQIMAIEGRTKAILSKQTEAYDLVADPLETHDLGSGAPLSAAVRKVLDEYPVPTPGGERSPDRLSDEARRSLASLGYVSATATPVIRKGAPRPVDMVSLFDPLERVSTLFVQEQYALVIPLLADVLKKDPDNLDATLRLATAYSSLHREKEALQAFTKAAAIAPSSADVRLYLALHYARGREWQRAVPELERIVADTPERLPALEALAVIRDRQRRTGDSVALRRTIYRLREPTAAELVQLGRQAMGVQLTEIAIEAFERARGLQKQTFTHDLELGVLYLAMRKLDDSRNALDRVPPTDPDYPLALFKRAQVSVLLEEPDAAARIESARRHADSITRPLIAKEKLFSGVPR